MHQRITATKLCKPRGRKTTSGYDRVNFPPTPLRSRPPYPLRCPEDRQGSGWRLYLNGCMHAFMPSCLHSVIWSEEFKALPIHSGGAGSVFGGDIRVLSPLGDPCPDIGLYSLANDPAHSGEPLGFQHCPVLSKPIGAFPKNRGAPSIAAILRQWVKRSVWLLFAHDF